MSEVGIGLTGHPRRTGDLRSDGGTPSAPPAPRPGAFSLGLCYFIFYGIYGVTSPFMPVILKGLGYKPSAIGVLLAVYELVGIGGPIFLARKADLSGRSQPFLRGSALAVILGLGLLVGLPAPLLTVASLGFVSLGLKTPIPILDAAILRTIEAGAAGGTRTPTYGAIRAFGSAGFVVVTLAVQFVPDFDRLPPWAIAACAAVVTLLFLVSVLPLPESGARAPAAKPVGLSLGWVDGEFLAGLGIMILGRLAMSAVNSFFSLYLVEELSWHAIGAMTALGATVEIPMMMLAWRLMRRRSPMGLIALSSAATVLRLLIYALFPTKGGVVVGQLLHAPCYGIFQPAAVAFVNLKTPPAHRTTGMALFLGLGLGLPLVLGSALGGFVVEAWGYRWLFAGFSLFALASMALYGRNRRSLDKLR